MAEAEQRQEKFVAEIEQRQDKLVAEAERRQEKLVAEAEQRQEKLLARVERRQEERLAEVERRQGERLAEVERRLQQSIEGRGGVDGDCSKEPVSVGGDCSKAPAPVEGDRSKASAPVEGDRSKASDSEEGELVPVATSAGDEIVVLQGDPAALTPWKTWEQCRQAMPECLVDVLMEHGGPSPTTIQQYVWPAFVSERDVVVDGVALAKSGSGRRLAYLVPVVISTTVVQMYVPVVISTTVVQMKIQVGVILPFYAYQFYQYSYRAFCIQHVGIGCEN